MAQVFKKAYRKHQTLFLSLLTFVVFVGAAVYVFDVPFSQLVDYFLVAIVGLFFLIGAACVSILLIKWIRQR